MTSYVPLYLEEAKAEHAIVCVTGATGFVAGPIIERLLAAGHTVHGTVRNPAKGELLANLRALPGATERLKIFKADLLQAGSFADAMRGCKYVLHTASPVFHPKTRAEFREVRTNLLEPAINGTKNVLEAVNACPTVERVVLTSSVTAIGGDAHYKGVGVAFTEEDWVEDVSEDCLPYFYSKRLAEEAAWAIANAQSRWRLVCIHPSVVMGPPIGDRADGESVKLLKDLFSGKFAVAPKLPLGIVDVRDVAAAHCLAMVHPNAQGRYICNEGTYSLHELGAFIKEKYPNQKVPSSTLPTWLVKLIGPLLGLDRGMIKFCVGKVGLFDHTKIERELGFQFHPIKVAVQDMADALVQFGQITPVGGTPRL